MKSFLSTRAGASFFYGSNRTVLYHKDTIEFILRFYETKVSLLKMHF